MFDQDPQSEEYDFTSGIQVAGLITYSSKIIRRDKLGENQVSLITRAIEERHKLATTEIMPILLNAHELVSLKLLAIGLAKDQAIN